MNEASWWSDSAPLMQTVPSDSMVLTEKALPPTGSIFAARMNGREMSDVDGVFTQFYDNLRLPNYFGWNWNALRDCLFDLQWLDATKCLVVIDDSEFILTEDADERSTFFQVLSDATEYWAVKPALTGRPKTSLRIVLLCQIDVRKRLDSEISESQSSR
ncbi:barstar family protein [Streptomyces sp. NPDC051320]|uniref:barstar family protein n=1 Tax=Streptomyces sp. NPDC051320 TaxID=3154644 RepID=UPI0034144AB4